MANFSSETVGINAPAQRVFDRLSNPENLKDLLASAPLDQVPADKRKALEGLKVTPDTISFPAGPLNEVTLRMTQRVSPTLIQMNGEGTPVAMQMALHIMPVSDERCEARVDLDIAIPAMIVPMIKGTLQKLVGQFAEMLTMVKF